MFKQTIERLLWNSRWVVLVAVVRIYDLPPRVLLLGLPLLVLATALNTYVGLVMTRGLRWPEATLAIVVMLALMGVAVLVAVKVGRGVRVGAAVTTAEAGASGTCLIASTTIRAPSRRTITRVGSSRV